MENSALNDPAVQQVLAKIKESVEEATKGFLHDWDSKTKEERFEEDYKNYRDGLEALISKYFVDDYAKITPEINKTNWPDKAIINLLNIRNQEWDEDSGEWIIIGPQIESIDDLISISMEWYCEPDKKIVGMKLIPIYRNLITQIVIDIDLNRKEEV